MFGEIPNNYDIHHKNNDTYDNRLENLELYEHNLDAKKTGLEQPNNHQKKDKITGKFITHNDSKKGRKVPVQMPFNLRSDYIGNPRVLSIEEGPVTDVYDISVEETNNLTANYIVAHNCGEQPLPPNGSCNLGSIDLSKFLSNGKLDYDKLELAIRLGIRILDSVIDRNSFPTKDIETVSLESRQVGLGIMGFADYLLMKKIAYGCHACQRHGRV